MMPEYECPICHTVFYNMNNLAVWGHFEGIHPMEWESIRMVSKLLQLFNRIGWPA